MYDGSTGQPIEVQICEPVLIEPDLHRCDFTILSASAGTSSASAYGADSVQAVMLSFDAIRDALKSTHPGAIWLGLPIDLAFPRTIPHVAGADLYREIEVQVDAFLAAKFS